MFILKISVIIIAILWGSYVTYGQGPQAVLKQDVALTSSSEHGQLCKAGFDAITQKSLSQDCVLIGQVKTTTIPASTDKIVQIVWTGVQLKNKKRHKGYFKHPLISTFKASTAELPSGTIIDLFGDLHEIDRTLDRLGQITTAQGINKNPAHNERRVENKRMIHDVPQISTTNNDISSDQQLASTTMALSQDARGHLNRNKTSATDHHITNPTSGTGPYGQSQHRARQRSSLQPVAVSGQSVTPSQAHLHTAQLNTAAPMGHAGITDSAAQANIANDGHKTSSSAANGKAEQSIIRKSKMPFSVDHDAQKELKLDAHQTIDIEVTEKGCTPRVDFEKGQYIIQNRSITRQGGKIIEESPCTDSRNWYAIKKDYDVCTDEVDAIGRIAYTRFRRYWLNPEGVRQYLDTSDQREMAHPFIDEPQNCSHYLDLTLKQAWRQVETVYYDRKNARQLVTKCHKVGGPLAIVETSKSCPLTHLFERKYSLVQNRSIFMDQGIEHTVVPCHESAQKITHEFIREDCQPILNDRTAIPTAKRYVWLNGKKQLITTQCEAVDKQNLIETTEGCENQFFDDFEAGRSYQTSRLYYLWKNKKQFVTSCQRSDKAYTHELHFLGYQNFDELLKSKPRMLVTVNVNGKTIPLRTLIETDEKKFFAYTKVREEARSTGGNTICLYYQNYIIWKRPDGSTFDQPGNSWSVNLPQEYKPDYGRASGSSTSSW